MKIELDYNVVMTKNECTIYFKNYEWVDIVRDTGVNGNYINIWYIALYNDIGCLDSRKNFRTSKNAVKYVIKNLTNYINGLIK